MTSPETLLHVDEPGWSVLTWERECARSLVDAQRRRRDAERRRHLRNRVVWGVLLSLVAVVCAIVAIVLSA